MTSEQALLSRSIRMSLISVYMFNYLNRNNMEKSKKTGEPFSLITLDEVKCMVNKHFLSSPVTRTESRAIGDQVISCISARKERYRDSIQKTFLN